jgi:hypothetical protein
LTNQGGRFFNKGLGWYLIYMAEGADSPFSAKFPASLLLQKSCIIKNRNELLHANEYNISSRRLLEIYQFGLKTLSWVGNPDEFDDSKDVDMGIPSGGQVTPGTSLSSRSLPEGEALMRNICDEFGVRNQEPLPLFLSQLSSRSALSALPNPEGLDPALREFLEKHHLTSRNLQLLFEDEGVKVIDDLYDLTTEKLQKAGVKPADMNRLQKALAVRQALEGGPPVGEGSGLHPPEASHPPPSPNVVRTRQRADDEPLILRVVRLWLEAREGVRRDEGASEGAVARPFQRGGPARKWLVYLMIGIAAIRLIRWARFLLVRRRPPPVRHSLIGFLFTKVYRVLVDGILPLPADGTAS